MSLQTIAIKAWWRLLINRELTQQGGQRQRKCHLKINIWEMVTITSLLLLLCTLYYWQCTLHMEWLKHRWSKYREWKIYCCVFMLSLKCHWNEIFISEIFSPATQYLPKDFFRAFQHFRLSPCSLRVYSEFWDVYNQRRHKTVLTPPRWLPILGSTSRV